ncbi:MAG: azurin [Bacteroidota bacterium]
MKFVKYFFMLLSVTLFLACGGGGEEKKDEKKSVTIGTTETKKKESSNAVNIGITGNDLMQFDKNEIRVKAGQEVTLTLRHVGKQELLIMGHNFVLLKQGVDLAAFGQAATLAGKDSDWIPNNGQDVIAHTKMIGGGQTTKVTFVAPAAGTYDFLCSFSGHWATMKGKFIVE